MSADEESAQGPDIAPETVEESSESATEETALAGQSEEDTGEEKSETDRPKPKGGFQRRISELTQQRRERDAYIAELEKRIKESEKQAPEAAPKRDDFDSYEEWTNATARHEARQAYRSEREAERQAELQRAEAARLAAANAEWEARNEAAFEKYDDYGAMYDAVGTAITRDIADAIRAADNGPDIVMHLGKHPDELGKLSKLEGVKAAIAIGRIEARLLHEAQARKSQAPEPIKPSRTTGARPNNALSDEDDMNAWLAKRRKQLYG